MKPVNKDNALFIQGVKLGDIGSTKSRETVQLYILSAYPKTQSTGGAFGSTSDYICKARTLEYHGRYTNRDGSEDWAETVNAIWRPKGTSDTSYPMIGQVWEAIILDTEGEGNFSLISVSGVPRNFFLKPNLEVAY